MGKREKKKVLETRPFHHVLSGLVNNLQHITFPAGNEKYSVRCINIISQQSVNLVVHFLHSCGGKIVKLVDVSRMGTTYRFHAAIKSSFAYYENEL